MLSCFNKILSKIEKFNDLIKLFLNRQNENKKFQRPEKESTTLLKKTLKLNLFFFGKQMCFKVHKTQLKFIGN